MTLSYVSLLPAAAGTGISGAWDTGTPQSSVNLRLTATAAAYTVQLQASADAATWVNAGSAATSAGTTTVPLSPSGRYFRVQVTGFTGPGAVTCELGYTAATGYTGDTGATGGTEGTVELAGDLGGTALSPHVTGTHLASALPVNQGGTGSATRNFAGLLTPTAVKTFAQSPYSAAAGDLVPVDTTSGAVTVNLPNAPADLTVVAIKHVIQGGTNVVTFATQGSDVFNKTLGATTGTLTLLAQGVVLQYRASGAIWYVTADDLPLSQLDSRYTRAFSAPNTATGAKFDGSTDDSGALNSDQLGASTLWLPGGTSVIGSSVSFGQSAQHIRGQGMYATTIKATAAITMFAQPATGAPSRVELSDMTLDGNNIASIGITSWGIGHLTVRRCRFINFPSYIIIAGYANSVTVEDCVAHGGGLGAGQFFSATNKELEYAVIRRNDLRYLQLGIGIGSTGFHAAYVEISENYCDGGWWLLASKSGNSGGTVTYTANTLTDTTTPSYFASVGLYDTIRVMPVRATGTVTSISGTHLTDTSATFTSDSIKRGEIIRFGSSFGVVSKVESATTLHVEEWLDQVSYTPVGAPSTGTSYTVYGVILGAFSSVSGNTITIAHGAGHGGGNWYDLTGAELTPSAGTLYEILPHHASYQGVFLTQEVEKAVVKDNFIRRSWADALELFGSRMIVSGNICEDGQDEGLVLQFGSHSTIGPNICRHNSTSGFIVDQCTDIDVTGVQVQDNGWGWGAPSGSGAQFVVSNSARVTVTGGRADYSGVDSITGRLGLSVGPATTASKVVGFTGTGHSVADIYVTTSVTAGANEILDCTGVVGYQSGALGQRIRAQGTGAPALAASPGSEFSRTDGGTGTILYVKETGTGTTGWTAFSAAPPAPTVPDVQFFTSSGTWTKPAGAQTAVVTVQPGGAGGGSGRRGAAGTIRCGGGGGASAPPVTRTFAASDLGSTATITIGAGGSGGAAVTANDTNGNAGGNASATSFGSLISVTSPSGGTGAGGTATTGTGGVNVNGSGTVGFGAINGTGASASATGGAGGPPNASQISPGGGPSGGGITSADVAGAGGNGAKTILAFDAAGGTAGVVDSTLPTTGTASSVKGSPGASAGSGAASITTAAQAGANAAANTGAGGAGGGASLNGNNSGAGGNGGSGWVLVLTYFQ